MRHVIGQPFAARFTIPLLECLGRDLALDEELRELAPLRLALERHECLLAPADPVGIDNVGNITVTPDGRPYCYTYIRRLGALFIVDGLK